MREWLSTILPPTMVDFALTAIVIVGGVLFITQNVRILRFCGKAISGLGNLFNKLLGRKIKNFNTKVLRSAYLNKETFQYSIVKYFEEMIMNLDLHKDGVTVTGLMLFMLLSTTLVTIFVNSLMSFGLLLPLIFVAIFIVFFIVFRLISMTQLEKREEMIMDAVDFLVSDIKGGVFNAMMRYEDSFNPAIKPYFTECIDDVRNKGMSFENAMLKLNAALGVTFTDFAYKAIIYEAKADDGLEDLFSSIIEVNRNRRNLRYLNNIEFNSLQMEFVVSMIMILFYGLIFMATDAWAMEMLTQRTLGRVLVIVDVVIIAAVLGFITNIKAKSL